MKRRQFLKSLASSSAVPLMPVGLTLGTMPAYARNYSNSEDFDAAGFNPPAVMPQIIEIFLHGGAAELAANLTNIGDIHANSQNSYTAAFGNGILNAADSGGQITKNNFWKDAGGTEMEAMLAANQMSIYRTMYRTRQNSLAHINNVQSVQKGGANGGRRDGHATTLAAFLNYHRGRFENTIPLADGTLFSDLHKVFIPFTLVGPGRRRLVFSGAKYIPQSLRQSTLGNNANNPFRRKALFSNNGDANNEMLDQLAQEIRANRSDDRLSKSRDSLAQMDKLVDLVDTLANSNNVPPSANYPDTTLGNSLKSSVTLALLNPSSFYTTIAEGGIGVWDHHNNANLFYPSKMAELMQCLQAACNHLRDYDTNELTTYGRTRTTTNNIIINVYSEFGRRVSITNSRGWDHGNNQNFFTLMGSDFRPEGLGKLVGETHRIGTSGENDQYLVPLGYSNRLGTGSPETYTIETQAMAASIYSYFGAVDTRHLTDLPDPEDPNNRIGGVMPIDQTANVANLYKA